MPPAVVAPRMVRAGSRRSSPVAFVVAAVLLVAVAIGALLPSPDDEPTPTAAAADAAALEAPAVASRELPVVDVPLESAPASPPVEALSPGSDRETSAFRNSGQVVSTWGEPAPTGVRAMCTLVVIDDLDRPVPGASVRLWGDEQPPVQGHVRYSRTKSVGPFESTTGADGRCEVRPPPYRPRARVEKEGVGRSNLVELSPRDERDQYKLVVVPLIRPAHLLGRVERADGSPAPGIAVGISEFASLKGSEDASSSLVTDAAGRFECDVLGEARVKLLIVYEETKSCESWFETRSGETRQALLRLPGSWTLTGRLVREDGTPVEGATVEFEPDPRSDELGSEVSLGFLHARTDEAGRFEIEFRQPAGGRLKASGARFVGLVERPHVIVDRTHPNPDVTLIASASGSIAGRVVDEAGKPLARVQVAAVAESIRRDGTASRERDDGLQDVKETRTGDDGGFELAPLHPRGVFTILAEHGKSGRVLSARHVSTGTRDLVLALGDATELRASLTLVVSEAASGRRVDRFMVGWEQHDIDEPSRTFGWGGQAYEGTSGIAELAHQPDGVTYDAMVMAEGLGSAFVTGMTATIEGTTVKVSLPALASLEVDVTDGGAPAAWGVVEVERREFQVMEVMIHPYSVQRRSRADEHGHVRLTELEPGRYGVRVTHGGRGVVREIQVEPGAAARLAVDLP